MKRKLISVLLATAMVAALLVGCGSKSTTETAGETEKTEETGNSDDSEKKVLRVGIECAFAPYNWTQEEETVANGDKAVKIANASGYAYGYDVKLAQMIADELGWELEIYKSDWSAIFMGLESNTYDCIMSGVCYSDEREKIYDFTTPYYMRVIKAVVRDDSEFANLTGLSQFDGLNPKVTTQLGTSYMEYKPQVPSGIDEVNYETSMECFMAVQNQTADVCVLDLTTAQSALTSMTGLKMLDFDESDDFVAPEGISNDCCMLFREGDPIRDEVQGALDSLGWTTENSDKMDEMMAEMLELQPSSN